MKKIIKAMSVRLKVTLYFGTLALATVIAGAVPFVKGNLIEAAGHEIQLGSNYREAFLQRISSV